MQNYIRNPTARLVCDKEGDLADPSKTSSTSWITRFLMSGSFESGNETHSNTFCGVQPNLSSAKFFFLINSDLDFGEHFQDSEIRVKLFRYGAMRKVSQLSNSLIEDIKGFGVVPGRRGGIHVEQLHAGQHGVEAYLFVRGAEEGCQAQDGREGGEHWMARWRDFGGGQLGRYFAEKADSFVLKANKPNMEVKDVATRMVNDMKRLTLLSAPSKQPSLQPSLQQLLQPSRQPSLQPSLQPLLPLLQPSLRPPLQKPPLQKPSLQKPLLQKQSLLQP